MRSCAIRRGVSKKRATEIFDLSLRVGLPPSWSPWSLRGLLCKFFASFCKSAVQKWQPKILAKLRDVPCQQGKEHKGPGHEQVNVFFAGRELSSLAQLFLVACVRREIEIPGE